MSKIVAMGDVDRCVTLDSHGKLRLWDTSRSAPNDKEGRQIDETSFTEDTFRCFDVIQRVGGKFATVHGLIIAAQGRRQHTYKILDSTPKESPPVQVCGI